MTELPFHPLANIFPLIEGEEFRALVEDVRAHGLRQPIVVFEGMVLDGRNRQRACIAAQVPTRYEMFDGADPVAFVVSANLRRRHMSEDQRAMAAAKLANYGKGRPSTNPPIGGLTQDAAADMLNVSVRSVQRATVIRYPNILHRPDNRASGRKNNGDGTSFMWFDAGALPGNVVLAQSHAAEAAA